MTGPSTSAVRAIRLLEIDRVTGEVVEELRRAGIASILLKGPALARWLFGDGSERTYVDCDLLVAADTIDAATHVLSSLGFRRSSLDLRDDWPRHALVFTRAGVSVDLHRTLVGARAPTPRIWQILSKGTESMRVGGTDVEVPSEPARALVVALHAAKDGERVPKVDRDLERAVDRLPIEVWEEAASLAWQLDASQALAAGLRRIPDGAAVARRLRLPSGLTSDLALRTRRVPPLATGIHWLVTSPGVRGKAGLVVRKLFPPPDFLRAWKPLARRGPAGLAAAAAWRPLWVAWHGIPASISVIRAMLHAEKDRA